MGSAILAIQALYTWSMELMCLDILFYRGSYTMLVTVVSEHFHYCIKQGDYKSATCDLFSPCKERNMYAVLCLCLLGFF